MKAVAGLAPLEHLYDAPIESATNVPLPAELARLYGSLRLPRRPGRPYVIGNFVTTLDGVVTLNAPGKSGGGQISGFNQHDKAVMGLLRAVSDAVIVGAGTLRSVPKHVWTAEHIFPPLKDAYAALREAMGKPGQPLNVIVSASGSLDMQLPVFSSGSVRVLVVTTADGAGRLRRAPVPSHVEVVAASREGRVTAGQLFDAVAARHPPGRAETVLVEGGPQLMGDYFGEKRLDALFLTIAPQVAGRDGGAERPGLVAGRLLAPDDPVWGRLVSVKRAGDHLFLRYAFDAGG